MTTQKTRLSNGWELTCGDLTILVPDMDGQDEDRLLSDINEYVSSGEFKSRLTPEQWRDEVRRLQAIMASITDGYPEKLNIFQYLPLTKAGKFPENRNILIADSKASTAALYDGGAYGSYPSKRNIQLRLMPYYATTMDFIHDSRMADTRVLRLDWNDAVRKQRPVFDENGTPSKPEDERASYLKDTEVRPGFIYEEKSGSQYVCLDDMEFGGREIFIDADGNRTSYANGLTLRKSGMHSYVKWTKKLETALAGRTDFNAFAHAMADGDKTEPWCYGHRISSRCNPRKFVREVGPAFDPALTRTESWSVRVDKTKLSRAELSCLSSSDIVFQYYVFRDNTVPEGWEPPEVEA